MDISTTYLGLKLDSPIIVGSSGLTGSVEKITAFAHHGAGAVVLKSIFEEEIYFEQEDVIKEAEANGVNLDQFDYYDVHLKGQKLERYIDLIKAAKQAVHILRIPTKGSHPFRLKRATYSARSGPPDPLEVGHPIGAKRRWRGGSRRYGVGRVGF